MINLATGEQQNNRTAYLKAIEEGINFNQSKYIRTKNKRYSERVNDLNKLKKESEE